MNTLRNRVNLIGHLGQNPEIKKFDNNKQKASFSVATTEFYKDAKGNKASSTQWHNLVAWDHMAEIAEKHLSKGSEVSIEGKLTSRSYEDKEGKTRYITEVVVNEILLIKSRKEN